MRPVPRKSRQATSSPAALWRPSLEDPMLATTTTTCTQATTATATSPAAAPQAVTRKLRVLVSREDKLRAALAEDARRGWVTLVNQESWSRAAIASFLEHRQQQEDRVRHQRATDGIWQAYLVEESMKRTVDQEELARAALGKQEQELRRTLAQLWVGEGRRLWACHRVAELVKAERTRRGFLCGEEVRAALELGIPGYEPAHTPTSQDGENDVSRVATAKLDYLKQQCCPFASPADCPFLPAAIRYQLERRGPAPRAAKSLAAVPSLPLLLDTTKDTATAAGPARQATRSQRRTPDARQCGTLSLHFVRTKDHYKHTLAAGPVTADRCL